MDNDLPRKTPRHYLWLFGAAGLGLLLLPIHLGGGKIGDGLIGDRFQIGWPISIAEAKIVVGEITPAKIITRDPFEYRFAPSWHIPFALLFWLVAFLAFRRVGGKNFIPSGMLYVGVVVFFCMSLALLSFQGYSFLEPLFRK